jgi:hypothetical protein
MAVFGQYEIREPGTYLNEYRINGGKPTNFAEFGAFIVEAPPGRDPSDLQGSRNGDVSLSGRLRLISGREFPFVAATLIKGPSGAFEELSFTTELVQGTYFTFKGRFLPRPKQEKAGGDYTDIRGVLTKFRNGRRVGSRELPFYEFSSM